MAIHEIRSNLRQVVAANLVIATDTTTAGEIIDTAHYDLGVMFSVMTSLYSAGDLALTISESDDPGMAGATVVPVDKLIGALPSATAAIGSGDDMQTVGVISTKRYLQVTVVSTNSANYTAVVIATLKAELMPTQPNSDAGILG
jgi:hypothetical protein